MEEKGSEVGSYASMRSMRSTIYHIMGKEQGERTIQALGLQRTFDAVQQGIYNNQIIIPSSLMVHRVTEAILADGRKVTITEWETPLEGIRLEIKREDNTIEEEGWVVGISPLERWLKERSRLEEAAVLRALVTEPR